MRNAAVTNLKPSAEAAAPRLGTQTWQNGFERRKRVQQGVALAVFGLAYAALMVLIFAPHLFRAV